MVPLWAAIMLVITIIGGSVGVALSVQSKFSTINNKLDDVYTIRDHFYYQYLWRDANDGNDACGCTIPEMPLPWIHQ